MIQMTRVGRLSVYTLFLTTFVLSLVVSLDTGLANPKPLSSDGKRYPVESLTLEYSQDDPGMPSVDDLMNIEVRLGESDDGYVAPREEFHPVRVRLKDIAELQDTRFYASAIRTINQAIVDEFVQRGYADVFVAPAKGQFSPDGKDLRPASKQDLRIKMKFGQVVSLTTTSSGERFETTDSNNAAHERIRRKSPIGPSNDESERTTAIRKDLLDDYLFQLNRHPGRRVDATLSPTKSGGVSLEYMVNENKEWLGYAQFSNNGTDQTQEWRQRLGYVNYQFTNSDDVFSFDYVTAGFSDMHAGVANYDRPFMDSMVTRFNAHMLYSKFTSSDVGIFLTDFEGDEFSFGADVTHNFYQRRNLFWDFYGGFNFRKISADNVALAGNGDEQFFIPRLGVRMERKSDLMTTTGNVELEFAIADLVGTSSEDAALLGRGDPDVNWQAIKWSFNHSFYLEPLLDRDGWDDASTPGSSTLAHEISIGLRGQYGFDYRLIPHAQMVTGGVYSVRGYEESLVAGDTAFVGNFEYRFHIPRTFKPQKPKKKVFGKPFRYARESVYGRPDWDLVAKAFLDIGTTDLNDEFVTENEHTLVGAGFGFDLMFFRNLSIRADFGWALEPVDNRVDEGDSEFHFVTTLLF